jgi:hypothetical protein
MVCFHFHSHFQGSKFAPFFWPIDKLSEDIAKASSSFSTDGKPPCTARDMGDLHLLRWSNNNCAVRVTLVLSLYIQVQSSAKAWLD